MAFKPRTDDIREAPALALIDALLARGARLAVHDPEAMEHVRALYGDQLLYCDSKYDALNASEALAIMTEWKQFVHPDFDEMRRRMKPPAIFDGRNLYEPAHVRAAGFGYHSIGRASVDPVAVSGLLNQLVSKMGLIVRPAWAGTAVSAHSRIPNVTSDKFLHMLLARLR